MQIVMVIRGDRRALFNEEIIFRSTDSTPQRDRVPVNYVAGSTKLIFHVDWFIHL